MARRFDQLDDTNQLEGRQARCVYCRKTQPSDPKLPFFEYRGPGSRIAEIACVCGYHLVAHERQPNNVDSRSVVERGKCTGFVLRGPLEFDDFYDGCRGWD
jgi:hypothetical protein